MLIRFARRLANWEGSLSVDELQKGEFKARNGGPDLAPSVYAVANQEETIQACAEHSTQFEPGKSLLGIDVEDAATSTNCTRGNPTFAFIRDHHREVVLQDEEDLRTFIGSLITNLPQRRHEVAKADILAYAKGQLQQADAEWKAAVSATSAPKWLKKL